MQSLISFAIMALMFLIVLLQRRMLRGKIFQTITGKGYSPRLIELGPWRWPTFALCVVFFLIRWCCRSANYFGSFFKFFGFYQWDMLTLEHYRAVLGNREVWRAFRNTIFLGLVGATLTMCSAQPSPMSRREPEGQAAWWSICWRGCRG